MGIPWNPSQEMQLKSIQCILFIYLRKVYIYIYIYLDLVHTNFKDLVGVDVQVEPEGQW